MLQVTGHFRATKPRAPKNMILSETTAAAVRFLLSCSDCCKIAERKNRQKRKSTQVSRASFRSICPWSGVRYFWGVTTFQCTQGPVSRWPTRLRWEWRCWPVAHHRDGTRRSINLRTDAWEPAPFPDIYIFAVCITERIKEADTATKWKKNEFP